MPYYKISIQDKQGRVRNGIRFNEIDNIDLFYRKARQKAITALKNNFEDIEVVMLSRYSKELKRILIGIKIMSRISTFQKRRRPEIDERVR